MTKPSQPDTDSSTDRSTWCRYCDRETLEKRCPKCGEEAVCYLCGSCGTEDCGYVVERGTVEWQTIAEQLARTTAAVRKAQRMTSQLISAIHYHDTHPCSDRGCPYYIDNIVLAVNNHAKLLKALQRVYDESSNPNIERIAAAAIEEAQS